jgi:hypothetical protein
MDISQAKTLIPSLPILNKTKLAQLNMDQSPKYQASNNKPLPRHQPQDTAIPTHITTEFKISKLLGNTKNNKLKIGKSQTHKPTLLMKHNMLTQSMFNIATNGMSKPTQTSVSEHAETSSTNPHSTWLTQQELQENGI